MKVVLKVETVTEAYEVTLAAYRWLELTALTHQEDCKCIHCLAFKTVVDARGRLHRLRESMGETK